MAEKETTAQVTAGTVSGIIIRFLSSLRIIILMSIYIMIGRIQYPKAVTKVIIFILQPISGRISSKL